MRRDLVHFSLVERFLRREHLDDGGGSEPIPFLLDPQVLFRGGDANPGDLDPQFRRVQLGDPGDQSSRSLAAGVLGGCGRDVVVIGLDRYVGRSC